MSSKDKPTSENDKPRRVLRTRRSTPSEDDVGYGKPPRAHQFKAGQSGNPKGRPKGVKSRETILREVSNRKISFHQDGTIRKITCLEGVIYKIVEKSLKGDTRSATLLLSQLAAIASPTGPEPEMNPDDKAVLDAYLQTFQSKLDDKKSPK
ncbi:hypothetical protein ASC80_12510 [Afipia sp. Root123D2]|uniref:DUF5681 domain-containing protein n=1 Tax=Afipia sp. Root123D2 TaxID=1736436 RepID=UPI0006F4686D|nr:DUF5681 domain-containing protein [Afipia sp. Root123D2]KQW20974.1 hypothetical protein ASC80_12510 [Afipia sp. Root123D2]